MFEFKIHCSFVGANGKVRYYNETVPSMETAYMCIAVHQSAVQAFEHVVVPLEAYTIKIVKKDC